MRDGYAAEISCFGDGLKKTVTQTPGGVLQVPAITRGLGGDVRMIGGEVQTKLAGDFPDECLIPVGILAPELVMEM